MMSIDHPELFEHLFRHVTEAPVEELAQHAAAADMGGDSAEAIANGTLEEVAHVMNDQENIRMGEEMADRILGHIDHVMYGTPEPTFGGDMAACAQDYGTKIIPIADAPKFGAGTCWHCGGHGYTQWPSGAAERCWYCQGTGVNL
jgi:hypothetical protein